MHTLTLSISVLFPFYFPSFNPSLSAFMGSPICFCIDFSSSGSMEDCESTFRGVRGHIQGLRRRRRQHLPTSC